MLIVDDNFLDSGSISDLNGAWSLDVTANHTGLVDISYDDGSTWTNLLKLESENSGGPNSLSRVNERIGLLANNPTSGSAIVRFGYVMAGNDWWWAIDNINIIGEQGVANLTAEKLIDTANGKITSFNADGSFEYTPNAGFFGIDTFSYRTKSGSNFSPPATISITVNTRPTPSLAKTPR